MTSSGLAVGLGWPGLVEEVPGCRQGTRVTGTCCVLLGCRYGLRLSLPEGDLCVAPARLLLPSALSAGTQDKVSCGDLTWL